MPRFTRNSLESAPANAYGCSMSTLSPASSTMASASLSSLATATPSARTVSETPSATAETIVSDVVQALQGTLADLVGSAIDARLSSLPSSSSPVSTVGIDEANQQLPPSGLNFGNVVATDNTIVGAAANRATSSSHVSSPGTAYGMGNEASDARGRLVPSFINSFSAPCSTSLVWSSGSGFSSPSMAFAPGGSPAVSLSYPGASLNRVGTPLSLMPQSIGPSVSPFIVGPGYAPIPAKTVSAIVSGKFINLADLLPENSYTYDESNEPQLMLDGRLILTGSIKKQRKELTDIISWLEAFTIYSVIVCNFGPHRWRDLTVYKLLILRTYRQFHGLAW